MFTTSHLYRSLGLNHFLVSLQLITSIRLCHLYDTVACITYVLYIILSNSHDNLTCYIIVITYNTSGLKMLLAVFSMTHKNEKWPFDIVLHGAIVPLVNFSSKPLFLDMVSINPSSFIGIRQTDLEKNAKM